MEEKIKDFVEKAKELKAEYENSNDLYNFADNAADFLDEIIYNFGN